MAHTGLRRGGDQAEVGHLHLAGAADQHVLGLDVAVHEPAPMRLRQAVEHRDEHGHRRRDRQRPRGAQDVAQRAALDEFHDEEHDRIAVAEHAGALVVHVHDGRMVDPGRRACLALEPGPEHRIGGQARVHHLHRDGPVQPGVRGSVDRGHSTAGQHRAQAVAAVQQRSRYGAPGDGPPPR